MRIDEPWEGNPVALCALGGLVALYHRGPHPNLAESRPEHCRLSFHHCLSVAMGNAKLAESTVRELGDGSKAPSLQDASSLDNGDVYEAVPEVFTKSKVPRARSVAIIVTLSGISFLNTMGSGILIAALPRIANDVGLDKSLILVSFHLLLLCNK